MNYNIFSPKGEIDRSTFVIYYVAFIILYFITGWIVFPVFLQHKWTLLPVEILLLFINFLILFNYQKRVMQFLDNVPVSILLSIILTFDHLCLPLIATKTNSYSVFITLIVFLFVIQPAVVAIIPPINKTND